MQLLSIFHPLRWAFVCHLRNANKIPLRQNFQPQGELLFLESSLGLGQRREGNPTLCSWANSTANLKMICLFLSSRLGSEPASHWASSSSQKKLRVWQFFFGNCLCLSFWLFALVGQKFPFMCKRGIFFCEGRDAKTWISLFFFFFHFWRREATS